MENSNLEKLINENSIININLDKTYASSEEFWSENESTIYSKIIDIFERFSLSDENGILGITVSTKIDGDSQKIYFGFEKHQPQILIELLMPYYIEREEYEICAKIRDLYNNFKNL